MNHKTPTETLPLHLSTQQRLLPPHLTPNLPETLTTKTFVFTTANQRKNFLLRDFSFSAFCKVNASSPVFAIMSLQPASWDVPLFRIQPLTQPTITKRTSSKLKTHLRTLCSFALPSHAPFLIQNSPPPQNTLSALTTNPTKHQPPKLPPHNGKMEWRASWRAWSFLTNFLSSSLFPF